VTHAPQSYKTSFSVGVALSFQGMFLYVFVVWLSTAPLGLDSVCLRCWFLISLCVRMRCGMLNCDEDRVVGLWQVCVAGVCGSTSHTHRRCSIRGDAWYVCSPLVTVKHIALGWCSDCCGVFRVTISHMRVCVCFVQPFAACFVWCRRGCASSFPLPPALKDHVKIFSSRVTAPNNLIWTGGTCHAAFICVSVCFLRANPIVVCIMIMCPTFFFYYCVSCSQDRSGRM
jgi:hypothetical protein